MNIIDQVAMFGDDRPPPLPKKRITEMVFIRRMLAYSARKNSAKGPAAYSTLKPETSSDSPSTKSNGLRFVSAMVDTTHIKHRGQVNQKNDMFS